ncbi:hypothetical protein Agabi119p4_9584 [Agaricus bisporus var. burnettii]|uniref:Chitin synthase export chaperone n=1 Tax=Agaricus bisporus var. burnettii TaxID=192524 RepID=A0A8H7EX61_AGABI|nr:hypothetical protein AGABI2DRAFT_194670 [Agaricus bisporus var. bisporus H97]EKV44761.1 hypothetical protein AGABI2DRAFT_194670 [Agaricus bisporus var. bisporus H97]KAF7761592.1 hypothetical protein Agabi119p4_9584 [Agaricus bisporus var. burnettii]
MNRFGEYKELCKHASSYALCNLFYLQIQREAPDLLGSASQRPFAPVGINPVCGIPKLDTDGSHSNLANNVLCGVSIIMTLGFLWGCQKRIAAVGRVEFRAFLVTYFVSLVFQLVTAGALLEQGTRAIGVLTAIHTGIVSAMFWTLLWYAITTTQILDDGGFGSLIVMHVGQLAFFVVTLYISLDTAFGFTSTFGTLSHPPDSLRSIPLFVLTSIWPAAAALGSFLVITYVVVRVLHERRPVYIYFAAAFAFIVAQVFRLSPVGRSICQSSDMRVDASFIATFLETVSIVVMYYAWADMTKASWDEFSY